MAVLSRSFFLLQKDVGYVCHLLDRVSSIFSLFVQFDHTFLDSKLLLEQVIILSWSYFVSNLSSFLAAVLMLWLMAMTFSGLSPVWYVGFNEKFGILPYVTRLMFWLYMGPIIAVQALICLANG